MSDSGLLMSSWTARIVESEPEHSLGAIAVSYSTGLFAREPQLRAESAESDLVIAAAQQ